MSNLVVVRVGRMAANLPYPVQVKLPPIGVFDHRVPRTTGRELDIVVPGDPARHTALGVFMDSWSMLESRLQIFLSKLMDIEISEAELILSRLGAKNGIDVLDGLVMRKLVEPDWLTFQNLTQRLGKL